MSSVIYRQYFTKTEPVSLRLRCHRCSASNDSCTSSFGSNIEEHDSRVFDSRLDLPQEGHCLSAVDETVIISECYVHHGTYFHLQPPSNTVS
jgi:hypothetical protein